MHIQGDDYQVQFNSTTSTITFAGTLRLRGVEEYAPLVDLLYTVAAAGPTRITLDLRKLQFLNSAGINILFVYLIKLRDAGRSALTVRGAPDSPWQSKSLQNFQKLMPEVQLELPV